jgi:acetylornithine/N-succinyldiaminopimelate aminotransferase
MDNIFELDKNYILNTYKRLPIEVKFAKGSFIYDINHKKYLDMFSGIAVSSLGHLNKEVVNEIKKQLKKYMHLSNYFVSKNTVSLAKLLVEKSSFSKVFFTNSGTEAVEASIKLVKKYGKSINLDKVEIIALNDSFHGRTIGGLSLTGQDKYKVDFLPLLDHVIHVDRNDLDGLTKAFNSHTCAIFLEIVQGESGVIELTDEFVKLVGELAKKHQALIVVDEIQTGILRTGKLFSYLHKPIKPDIMTLAKSLGGGLPLGAMLVSKDLESILSFGDHGSTFGGNPVATTAGLKTFEILSHKDMEVEVNTKSLLIFNRLRLLKNKYEMIKEVRGLGLMIGIDVGTYANQIKEIAFEKGLLLNVTNQNIIRLLPPLNITDKEIKLFFEIFENVLKEIKV